MHSRSDHNVLDIAKFFKRPKQLPKNTVALNTLEAALRIVAHAHDDVGAPPRTATPEMIRSARRVTNCSAEELQKIWRAMLQAW